MSDVNHITSSFELLTSIQNDISESFSRLFDINLNVKEEKKNHLSQLPYHINVIDELHINENAHSRILAKILQFRDIRGKYEILESLIDFIKRKKRTKDFNRIRVETPIITQEKERVDLWVRDNKAKCALIFENKIYGAIDQESQLYNYIKATKEHGFENDEIYVFYLTKFGDEPSKQTWGNDETKLLFAPRFMQLSFREDILQWLKNNILPNIRLKDKYLSSAIAQYVDYLEGLFNIRNINKSLNMKLQKIISDKLQLDSYNELEALNIIQETITDFEEVIGVLKQMAPIAKKKLWNLYLNDLNSIVKSICSSRSLQGSVGFLNENESHLYIEFYKENWNLHIIFEKYDDDSLFVYIGIRGENTVKQDISDLFIFKEHSYRNEHPYGWEYISQFSQNSDTLMKSIKSGEFEECIKDKLDEILIIINNENVMM